MKKIILCFGLLLTACAANNMTPANIHVQNGNYLQHISATDTRRTSDDTLLVNITGQTYEDTDLYYKVKWFDANNMEIKSLLSKSVRAPVRRDVPFTWSAVAPNKKAHSYQIYISDRVIEQ